MPRRNAMQVELEAAALDVIAKKVMADRQARQEARRRAAEAEAARVAADPLTPLRERLGEIDEQLAGFIVAVRRNRLSEVVGLIARLNMTVIAVTEATARQVGEAYARWGKGMHSAVLNFGDCFAYALAQERRCPLLYVGDDFAQTDVTSAL